MPQPDNEKQDPTSFLQTRCSHSDDILEDLYSFALVAYFEALLCVVHGSAPDTVVSDLTDSSTLAFLLRFMARESV